MGTVGPFNADGTMRVKKELITGNVRIEYWDGETLTPELIARRAQSAVQRAADALAGIDTDAMVRDSPADI